MKRDTILCIDDEPNVLDGLRRIFSQEFEVHVADSAEKAFEVLAQHRIDLVICDFRMPKMTGVELLGRVKEEYPDTMRFLFTGHADLDVAVAAINEGGVHRFVSKPCNDHELKQIVRDAFEGYRLRLQNQVLAQQLANRYRELAEQNTKLKEQNELITALNQELEATKAQLQKKVRQIDAELFEAERRSSRFGLR